MPAPVSRQQDSQTDVIRHMKAEHRRVTEERDVLKMAPAHIAQHSGEARLR